MIKCNRCGGSGQRWNNAAEETTNCIKCENDIKLSKSIEKEEKQRSENAKNHKFECVPWRGKDGEIGACIYCGKMPDALTQYYLDRAQSGLASKTAIGFHR